MPRKRRSKRKSTILQAIPRRYSARKRAIENADKAIYGQDYVKASVIPGRVPLGYICGYPVRASGGEQYGGSMFTRSAASNTAQGKAIQAINEKWGEDHLQRSGRETIGIPVCKKKYNPFQFHVVRVNPTTTTTITSSSSCGEPVKYVEVLVERLYGCKCHHERRKEKIIKHGVRPGWQTYGVWSLRKALEVARREEIRLNQEIAETGEFHFLAEDDIEDDDNNNNNSNDETIVDDTISLAGRSSGSITTDTISSSTSSSRIEKLNIIRTINLPGNFTWKVKTAYDNIFKEIHGYSESDVEDETNNNKEVVARKKDSENIVNNSIHLKDVVMPEKSDFERIQLPEVVPSLETMTCRVAKREKVTKKTIRLKHVNIPDQSVAEQQQYAAFKKVVVPKRVRIIVNGTCSEIISCNDDDTVSQQEQKRSATFEQHALLKRVKIIVDGTCSEISYDND